MKILNGKLWTGSIILAIIMLVSIATVVGGFEWTLASLGALTLAGITGAGIYAFVKMKQYSKAFKTGSLEHIGVLSASYDIEGEEYDRHNAFSEVKPVSEKDKEWIIKHLDELFKIEQEQSEKELSEVKPITAKDKRMIIAHIDEFFRTTRKQDREKSTEPKPISEKDKKLIMAHIDTFFNTDEEHNNYIFT